MTEETRIDPRTKHPHAGFAPQHQDPPGRTDRMEPRPDHGEESYVGHGLLAGRKALITGGDSGIGRAVAIAFAREGADVAIAHLAEEQADADETMSWIGEAGRIGVSLPADLREEDEAERVVRDALTALGGLDLLVLNAGFQHDVDDIGSLKTSDIDRVFRTNLYSPLFTVRAARPHLGPGSAIIVTASIQAAQPNPVLIDYAMTKAAQVAFVEALAEDLGPDGIRVNAVAPGPIWTPLIPSTGWGDEKVASFGLNTPLGRAGQPAEVAGAYVFIASEAASYVSGAVIPVTGGRTL